MDVHISELIAAFRELGHEVIVVGPKSHASRDFGTDSSLLTFLRQLLPSSATNLMELCYDRLAYRKLMRAYRRHKPDILYERHNLFLSAGRRLKEETGIPYLLEVNSPLADERIRFGKLALRQAATRMEQEAWRSADKIYPVSTPLSVHLTGAGVSNNQIRVIPNGVDATRFDPETDALSILEQHGLSGAIVLGFAGFVRDWHGLDQVIAAIPSLPSIKPVHLLIMGDGPARHSLVQQSIELGIQDRVHFTGLISRTQMPQYLAAVDIALQPRVVEYASPLKLIEYMSSGRAIIAPDTENIRELVDHGKSAFLFSPNDPSGVETGIQTLLKDPELRSSLGENARNAIFEKNLLWTSNAQKIVDDATSIIGERRPTPSDRPPKIASRPIRETGNLTHLERSRVLVFGDDTRSFLAIVRSLGRKNIEVHAAPFNRRAAALRSRYIFCTHALPQYLGDGQIWIDALLDLVNQHHFNLIIPADDRAVLMLQEHRAKLPGGTIPAIPVDSAIEILFDKLRTRQLAQKLNVPIAAGRKLEGSDSADDLIETYGLPVIVKPRRSYTLQSIHARGRVEIVADRSALTKVLNSIEQPADYLVEASFKGVGIGLSVLAFEGSALQYFQHTRVREPNGGGGSSYRQSSPVDPDILAASQKILAEISYTGVAMFEFRLNKTTGQWILLEINARFWGSLPLATFSGVDFPYYFFQLLVEDKQIPRVEYRQDLYARNLALDLNGLITDIGRKGMGPVDHIRLILGYLGSYLRLLSPRESLDTFAKDDIKPGLAELRQVTLGRITDKVQATGLLTGIRRRGARARLTREISRLQYPNKIVFICMGNICRSPYAEHRLRRELGKVGLKIETSSFGLYPVEDRPSPENAVKAGLESDEDLSLHRSKAFDPSRMAQETFIIIFDRRIERTLYELYPDLELRVVFLQDMTANPSERREISDPNGCDLKTFLGTYGSIDRGIDGLVSLLNKNGPRPNR